MKTFEDFIVHAQKSLPNASNCQVESEQEKQKLVHLFVDYARIFLPEKLPELLDIAGQLCLTGFSALLNSHEKSPYLTLTLQDEDKLRLEKFNIIDQHPVSHSWEILNEETDEWEEANGLDQIFFASKSFCEENVDYYYLEQIGIEKHLYAIFNDGSKACTSIPLESLPITPL